MRVKDNWEAYNKARKRELGAFIHHCKRVLATLGPPSPSPPPADERTRGRPPYDPGSMLIVNLLRIYFKFTYREMETLLKQNGQLRRTIGLDNIPGRDTIHRYARRLSEDYLARFNDDLTARLKKTRPELPSIPPVSRSSGTRSVGTLPTQKARTG